MARGYTTAQLTQQELGVDLTAPQLDQVADLIADVEAFIDRYTGRAWIVTSPHTDELHSVYSPVVYLRNRPVTAVTSVKARSAHIGATETTLTAGTQYELLDAANGILTVSNGYPFDVVINTEGGYEGYLLKVTYTSSTPVPGDIQHAATLLAAEWMLPRLNPDYQGVESYRIAGSGDEYQVKLRTPGQKSKREGDALAILGSRRTMVLV